MDSLENKIYAALKTVRHKDGDIVARGMVTSLQVTGKDVVFVLEVDPEEGSALEPLRQQAE